jgi:nucleoside-diphosphate-sugar epimerase
MTEVTVLGGDGFIGRHLAAYFKTLGKDVWIPKRRSDEVFKRNLGRVVYAIGLTADFRSRPFETVEAHITHLARVLRNATFDSLLYLSSTRLYVNCAEGNELTPIIVNSNDSSDLYNLSKLMGESLALHCGRPGIRIARLSNVVGGTNPSDSFLLTLIQQAKAGEIFLQTSLSSRKDYLHIEDAVRMLSSVTYHGTHCIYNIAGGIQIAHGQWVEALREKFGCRVLEAPSAPEICFPEISIARFVEEFSFQPGSAIRALEALI